MKSENGPVLSICIGTYNRKKLLQELLTSILVYEGNEIEVIVCDNASTDGTWEMLQEIGDSRLHCYLNEQNYGAEYNWLKSRFLGQGKFLMNLNDREFLDMEEVKNFISEVKDMDVDAIVASGHTQCEQMNVNSYEDRVCLINKLGEPGDVIYSGHILQEYKKKYGGNIKADDVMACHAQCSNLYLKSDRWYWYGRRLVKDRPMKELRDIKVERRSMGYTFTGYVGGQIGICQSQIMMAPYIEEPYKMKYCQGIIKAYARTLFWTVWRSAKSQEICKRYNYVPPRHIFWLKEMYIWKKKITKCLIEQNCFNKEMNEFINCRLWNEYKEFLWYRICITKTVKLAVKIKHKIWNRNNLGVSG